MIIAVMSDLHNEFDRRGRRADLLNDAPLGHPTTGPSLVALQGKIDLLLLAGDIDIGLEAVRYGAAAAAYLTCPVVLIAGNHEFYNGAHHTVLAQMHAEAERYHNVTFLENNGYEITVNGKHLRILGATLWTDYALFGTDITDILRAMNTAQSSMSDHWIIQETDNGDPFTPQYAARLHRTSRAWLSTQLALPYAGDTIVMTHHGVSDLSLPQRFIGDRLSACFVSRMDTEVAAAGARYWIHGHTHHDVNYDIGETRVLSRQRGYPDEFPGGEETTFSPAMIEL